MCCTGRDRSVGNAPSTLARRAPAARATEFPLLDSLLSSVNIAEAAPVRWPSHSASHRARRAKSAAESYAVACAVSCAVLAAPARGPRSAPTAAPRASATASVPCCGSCQSVTSRSRPTTHTPYCSSAARDAAAPLASCSGRAWQSKAHRFVGVGGSAHHHPSARRASMSLGSITSAARAEGSCHVQRCDQRHAATESSACTLAARTFESSMSPTSSPSSSCLPSTSSRGASHARGAANAKVALLLLRPPADSNVLGVVSDGTSDAAPETPPSAQLATSGLTKAASVAHGSGRTSDWPRRRLRDSPTSCSSGRGTCHTSLARAMAVERATTRRQSASAASRASGR